MPDDLPRARRPISCPECGVLMEAGWIGSIVSLEHGGIELRWTNEAPAGRSGRLRFKQGRGVLASGGACWACWCEACRNLYARTTVSPTDEPDAEYPWSGIACLACGATIPAGDERCSSCGWTWGLDPPPG